MEIPKMFTFPEPIPPVVETEDEIDMMLRHMAESNERSNHGKPPVNLPF